MTEINNIIMNLKNYINNEVKMSDDDIKLLNTIFDKKDEFNILYYFEKKYNLDNKFSELINLYNFHLLLMN